MFLKRLFDIVISFLGLIILSPLFIAMAILIKHRMSGPIIFRQTRAGKHGKIFTIYKFRTMIFNHGGNTISVKEENRITPLGVFLRKHKLDELPNSGMSLKEK